ncbi:MAG: DMT family transporter [Thermodesulfobacteriota bacterium]
MNRNIMLLFFIIVSWGYSWVLMKQALNYMDPFTFGALRNSLGALCLIPFIYKKSSFNFSNLTNFNYAVIGFFQTFVMFSLIIYGMKFVTAGKTSVVLYTMPVWTSIFLHFFLKEKLSRKKWIGILFGIIGILFILGWDILAKQNIKILFGELLILMAAVSWAAANIWNRKKLSKHSSFVVNGYQLTIGSILLIILSVSTEGFFIVDWNYYSIFIILFTGIIASAINFSIWFSLINKMDINVTTFSSLLVPVFGLIFDWAILGTKLDIGLIVGGIFILLGIYKISKK